MVDEIGILGLKTSKLGSRDREGDCEVFFLQETELKWYLMYKLHIISQIKWTLIVLIRFCLD